MLKQALGIKLSRPVPAVALGTDTRTHLPSFTTLLLEGARRMPGGYRAAWFATRTWTNRAGPQEGNTMVHGRLYERPSDEVLAEVQEELLEIERERAATTRRLDERRARALAVLVPIPQMRTAEIEAWVAEREARDG